MGGPLNLEAPTALGYFAALVAEDAGFPLLEAAVAVGQDADPALDPQGVLAEVDALADRLRRRVPADAAPLQRLRLLHSFFFHELGFAGNVNDYYDARNSYLHDVLHTRRGIPITLALLFVEIASQIGLQAQGVSFPGHFLVKLKMPRGDVVIDPFSGQSLSREDLEERLEPFRQQFDAREASAEGATGDAQAEADDDNAEPAHGHDAEAGRLTLGAVLQAATPRETLARLLRNLKAIHRRAGDLPRLLAVSHRLVILLPDAVVERRDRGLTLAALGRTDLAAEDVAAYLAALPDAGDARQLRRRVATWRRGGRPSASR